MNILKTCTTLSLVFFVSFVIFQIPVWADDFEDYTLIKEYASQYYQKGRKAQEKGDREEALSYYQKAAMFGYENANMFNDLGVLYEQQGFVQQAEEYYLQSIELNAEYLPPYMNLAYLYKNRGNTQKSKEYFQKRFDLGDPSHPWTQKARAELMKLDPDLRKQISLQNALKEAEDIIKRKEEAFLANINEAEVLYQRGKALSEEDQYEQALAQYDQALTLTPENPKITIARDYVLAKMAIAQMRKDANISH